MTVFREYLVRAMLFRLLATTIILGVITGFVELSKAAFFRTLGGQIVQGLISIACFILVGVAFCRFGWKIGRIPVGPSTQVTVRARRVIETHEIVHRLPSGAPIRRGRRERQAHRQY